MLLIKKFNNRKPDICFCFKNYNLIIEVDEENHENLDSDDEKQREYMFKNHDFKIFWCNPNDLYFDLLKILGEINLYVSKLHKRNSVNGVISKITDDFKQIAAVTKLKELKRYVKNILPNYKKWKNKRIRKKVIEETRNPKREMRNETRETRNEKWEMRNEKLKHKNKKLEN